MPIINGQGGQAKFVIKSTYSFPSDGKLIAYYYNGAVADITGMEEVFEQEGIELPDPTIITRNFAEVTDEVLDAMIKSGQAGVISLDQYWTVGDTRSVDLSAMSATGVGESHVAQTVELVLMHSFKENGALGGISAGSKASFVVGFKDCLKEGGYMNSTNTNSGGWANSARRTWCNNVFPNSLPACFKDNMLTMTIGTYNNPYSTTSDKAALFAEKEIFDSKGYSYDTEANVLTQVEYYKTAANRIKKTNGSANHWWERSPHSSDATYFCSVAGNGSANLTGASGTRGLAPFFCI